jgi:hypothetical protein
VRARAAGRRFGQPVLVAAAVWGMVFYVRSLGRSDEPHLDSAIPPVCLLLGHAAGLAAARLRARSARAALGVAVFAAWVGLTATVGYLSEGQRGRVPVESLGGRTLIQKRSYWGRFDELVSAIQRETRPGDVILDLTASPLVHVATGRRGPGWADLVMPGTFLDETEERALIARLERRPPALVLVSAQPFDRMPERGLKGSAPRVLEWVGGRYAKKEQIGRFVLLAPARHASRPPRPEPRAEALAR